MTLELARMVAVTSYLPHPEVVRKLAKAVFPVSRGPFEKRTSLIVENGTDVGMYDDNTTPRWALLWAHGIPGVSKMPSAGWTFAHVWPESKDRNAYTHLANLVMVPECFASLTDKNGPLTSFLRYHAFARYGWKPSSRDDPTKPAGFDDIHWCYFDPIDDPIGFIHDRLRTADCQRSRILRPLLGL